MKNKNNKWQCHAKNRRCKPVNVICDNVFSRSLKMGSDVDITRTSFNDLEGRFANGDSTGRSRLNVERWRRRRSYSLFTDLI